MSASTGERGKLGFWLSRFLTQQRGVTAIEYGLIAAGIAVAIVATIAALGANLSTTYSSVAGGS
jgi:pilus assembly protein Flp/PilA